jgi:hypothetical protein
MARRKDVKVLKKLMVHPSTFFIAMNLVIICPRASKNASTTLWAQLHNEAGGGDLSLAARSFSRRWTGHLLASALP